MSRLAFGRKVNFVRTAERQQLEEAMATNWSNRIEITSTTVATKKYILAWNPDTHVWGCSCPAWRMQVKKNGGVRTCKHVRAIEGLQPEEMANVERRLESQHIETNFGKAIEEAKKKLLAAGYVVEDAADELRLQQEAEYSVRGTVS